MNEHEISVHVSNNSWFEIVQPQFATSKYKVKLSAEKKAVRKNFAIFTGKHMRWSL